MTLPSRLDALEVAAAPQEQRLLEAPLEDAPFGPRRRRSAPFPRLGRPRRHAECASSAEYSALNPRLPVRRSVSRRRRVVGLVVPRHPAELEQRACTPCRSAAIDSERHTVAHCQFEYGSTNTHSMCANSAAADRDRELVAP